MPRTEEQAVYRSKRRDLHPILAAEARIAPRYAAIRRCRRFTFTARHTKSHSPRTFASPRRLKRWKPSTCLIQPYGASDNHFRSAYTARPAGVDSFSTMRPVAGCFFRLRSATRLSSRPVATYRFYAAFPAGHATASAALQRLNRFQASNRFYAANRELGRALKTEFVLQYMSEPQLRAKVRRGLLKVEQLHALARAVYYGQRGRISAREVYDQVNACSCLTLILACIVYWQAREISRMAAEPDFPFDPDLLRHVSPIEWKNVVLYGDADRCPTVEARRGVRGTPADRGPARLHALTHVKAGSSLVRLPSRDRLLRFGGAPAQWPADKGGKR